MYIKKITHNYPSFCLDVSDIEIESNKIIGLIGENGAGKTTFMNLLANIEQSNGEFRVIDYEKIDILYIPSNLEPYEYLTVNEFVEVIRKYSKTNKSNVQILEFLELQNKKNTLISGLSQGMKKKLSLINIFIHDYQLIILDEPFNSVDVKYIYQLKKMMVGLKSKSTILISSHILDTLNDICDEFIYLKDGKVYKKFENAGNIDSLERELFD
ncbi:ATP-binding cassette domain-containing protein [Enterococcus sp. RIT-PI-f]|uniref:ATP-binding cassette domain-containing protein n=1 Tax=Enterococcus sp. RIT-PI-f TaxID=1690244 RepID=UPI00356B5328